MNLSNLNYRSFLIAIIIIAVLSSCTKDECEDNPCAPGCNDIPCPACIEDPCGNPELCPGQCGIAEDGSLTKKEFDGNLQQVGDHYEVEGKLVISLSETEKLELLEADLRLEFNEEGKLTNMSGAATIPSPTNYVEFGDLVKADIGYFSGKFLNENRNFNILLQDDKFYFVYNIALSVEMHVGANDDPDEHKPLTLKAPVGGHITYIADYSDPLYYFSGGHDLLGSMCFAASLGGNIPYIPLQPVEQGESFNGRALRCGKFSFFKVIEFSGVKIQNAEFGVQLTEENPVPMTFSAGYQAGFNGGFDLTVPVVKFVEFGIPLGEASGALIAEGNTQNGFKGLIFINGLADPDNSWWPNFIPVKPAAQLRGLGFVHQDGAFEIGLEGEFSLETPTNQQSIAGKAMVNNQEFLLEGNMLSHDREWTAKAVFEKDQTTLAAIPPDDLLNGLDQLVNEKIDSTFDAITEARKNLEDATEDYELEVSLRGLKKDIPVIVSEARKQVNAAVNKAIADGKSEAKKIVNDNNAALCSDNISSEVKKAAAPYYRILDRLESAVKKEDAEEARTELENALRDLIALKSINRKVRIRVTAGNKKTLFVSACSVFKNNYYRNVTINRQVLSNKQVDLLTQAADNIQYIPEASDRKIKAQEIFDRLPSEEELTQLKNDLQTGVKSIPTVKEVGFVNNYAEKSFAYYIIIGGDRKDIDAMEFNGGNLADVIIDLLK